MISPSRSLSRYYYRHRFIASWNIPPHHLPLGARDKLHENENSARRLQGRNKMLWAKLCGKTATGQNNDRKRWREYKIQKAKKTTTTAAVEFSILIDLCMHLRMHVHGREIKANGKYVCTCNSFSFFNILFELLFRMCVLCVTN